MVSDLGGAGDSFNRLQEMVGEEREKASARARVTGGSIDVPDLMMKEAEQEALAGQALEEFITNETGGGSDTRRALPDRSDERAPDSAPWLRADTKKH